MFDAVVLAGGEEHGPLREITGLAYRPLIEVGGRLLADRTLEAMRAARHVGRIALVCPEAALTVYREVPVRAASRAKATA